MRLVQFPQVGWCCNACLLYAGRRRRSARFWTSLSMWPPAAACTHAVRAQTCLNMFRSPPLSSVSPDRKQAGQHCQLYRAASCSAYCRASCIAPCVIGSLHTGAGWRRCLEKWVLRLGAALGPRGDGEHLQDAARSVRRQRAHGLAAVAVCHQVASRKLALYTPHSMGSAHSTARRARSLCFLMHLQNIGTFFTGTSQARCGQQMQLES